MRWQPAAGYAPEGRSSPGRLFLPPGLRAGPAPGPGEHGCPGAGPCGTASAAPTLGERCRRGLRWVGKPLRCFCYRVSAVLIYHFLWNICSVPGKIATDGNHGLFARVLRTHLPHSLQNAAVENIFLATPVTLLLSIKADVPLCQLMSQTTGQCRNRNQQARTLCSPLRPL